MLTLHYYEFPEKIYFKLDENFCKNLKEKIIATYGLRKLYKDIKKAKNIKTNVRSFIRYFKINLFPSSVLNYFDKSSLCSIESNIIGYRHYRGGKFIKASFPLKLDERAYYLIGCLFGDGCWRVFTNTNKELVENFRKCSQVFGEFKLANFFKRKSSGKIMGKIIKASECYYQNLPCIIPEIIEKLGIDLRKRKFPNSLIFKMSKHELTALFLGLYNTEGSFSSSGITIGNKNKNVIALLVKIARRLGIRYSVFPSRHFNALIFYVPRSNIRKLLKYIKRVIKKFPELEVIDYKFNVMKDVDYFKKIELFLLKVKNGKMEVSKAKHSIYWQQYYQALYKRYIQEIDGKLQLTNLGMKQLRKKGVI